MAENQVGLPFIDKKPIVVYESSIIASSYASLKKGLEGLIVNLYKGKLVFNYAGMAINACPADVVRVVSEWSQNDSLDLTIRNIIVNAVVSSENKQIGSGIICAMALTGLGHELLEINENEFLRGCRAEKKDLSRSIKHLVGTGLVSKISKACVDMGGISSESLNFNLTYNKNFVIKQMSTKRISGYISPMFENYPSRYDSATIILLDGVIESVGEIDHLLQTAASTKNNVIICARGFSPDVVYTLYQNWKEQRVYVFPFEVIDWPTENLKEYAESVGAVCVTHESGNILNTIAISVLPVRYVPAP